MLNFVLIANALSCALFGGIFVFWSSQTSLFIGNPPPLLIIALGLVLLINAVLLVLTALNKTPARSHILLFVFGDAAWVMFTFMLLISNVWITTEAGIVSSILVALFVGICAILQWMYAPLCPVKSSGA